MGVVIGRRAKYVQQRDSMGWGNKAGLSSPSAGMHRMVAGRIGNFGETQLSYLLSEAGFASGQPVAAEIRTEGFANRLAGPQTLRARRVEKAWGLYIRTNNSDQDKITRAFSIARVSTISLTERQMH